MEIKSITWVWVLLTSGSGHSGANLHNSVILIRESLSGNYLHLPILMLCSSHNPFWWIILSLVYIITLHAPLPMEFSRQEYWSEVPFPTPGDLPNPGIRPTSLSLLHWQVDSLLLAPPGKPNLIYIPLNIFDILKSSFEYSFFTFIMPWLILIV